MTKQNTEDKWKQNFKPMERIILANFFSGLMIACLLISCSSQQKPFLENAETTSSGLEYKFLKKGAGPAPVAGNEIKTHCILKIGDSTVIWSTRDDDKPFTFIYAQSELIPGFDETIGLMIGGDRVKVLIPPDLGYGPNGFGDIPANAYLSFDIEILEVNDLMLWIADSIFEKYRLQGSAAAMEYYTQIKNDTVHYTMHERQLSVLSGLLKNDGRLNDTFEVIKLRASEYPESFGAHFALGNTYEERGDKKEAITAFRKCLELSPENPAATNKLLGLE